MAAGAGLGRTPTVPFGLGARANSAFGTNLRLVGVFRGLRLLKTRGGFLFVIFLLTAGSDAVKHKLFCGEI